jgi:hypothetical protein
MGHNSEQAHTWSGAAQDLYAYRKPAHTFILSTITGYDRAQPTRPPAPHARANTHREPSQSASTRPRTPTPPRPPTMSGEGPESIPTSADPRSKRAVKKRALTPVSAQASSVDALFAKPDQEIRIPHGPRPAARTLAAPPEIVTNVQGSSAGAGSGEFHVYKASRRREYERLRAMDDEVRRERAEEDFDRTRAERDARDDDKTRRNREKREKMKARKAKAKTGGGGGGQGAGKGGANSGGGTKAARFILQKNLAQMEEHQNEHKDTDITDAPGTAEEPKGLVIEDD